MRQPVVKDDRSLKIVLCSTEKNWGGGEEQARLLALGLAERGHKVFITARHDGSFAEWVNSAGLPLCAVAGKGFRPAATWKLRQFLRDVQPHVLHFNDSGAVTSAGVASGRLSIPCRIAARRVSFPLRSARKYRALCDHIICVSHVAVDQCRQAGISAQRLSVVHDGVSVKRVSQGRRDRGRRALGMADDQPLILCVANLTDCKGHRWLLDAMPSVLQAIPAAALALAGQGELEEQLRQQANKLKINEQVRFLGFRHDVPDLIQAADVVVLPSYREGLGSSIVDAMLAGTPVVATTAGGIPELIGVEQDEPPVAWTVPSKSPEALAAALIECLSHPQESASRAARAAARAQAKFTAESMVENTLQVYRKLLASRWTEGEHRRAA